MGDNLVGMGDNLAGVGNRLMVMEHRFTQIENILQSVLEKLDHEKALDVKEEMNILQDEMKSVVHEK
jgi:6-pyruvoyl-tetrahydropterin synthase